MKSLVITSDCDHLLASEHINILKMLAENEIFITTAVFARVDNEDSWLGRHCSSIDTHGWENKELRKGLIEAQAMGHEIAFHGTSQCSNTRDEFIKGIDEYKYIFGEYPFTYIEHGPNPLIRSHKTLEFKSELLSNHGSDVDSDYYIKDIVKDVFGAYWNQTCLLDEKDITLTKSDWIKNDNDITYVNRARMLDFTKFKSDLINSNNVNATFIGYTHFGYEGFFGKRRQILLNAFRPLFKSRFEYWKGKNLERNIKEIKKIIDNNKIRSITLKNLVKDK